MNGTAKYSTDTSIETSSSGSTSTPSAIHSLRPALGPPSCHDTLQAICPRPHTVYGIDRDHTHRSYV